MLSYFWKTDTRDEKINELDKKINESDQRILSLEKELQAKLDSISKCKEKDIELENSNKLIFELQCENKKLQRMLTIETETEDQRKERLLGMLLTSEEYSYLFELVNKKVPYFGRDKIIEFLSSEEEIRICAWGFDDNEGFNMFLWDIFIYEVGNRDYQSFEEDGYIEPKFYYNDPEICHEKLKYRDFLFVTEKLENMPDV
ncbi:Hypothetical protein HVR_LOCUS889 [uncultured virus]|nr:Hypothetical protein HVR_LOCUS889 [uncultured virus]